MPGSLHLSLSKHGASQSNHLLSCVSPFLPPQGWRVTHGFLSTIGGDCSPSQCVSGYPNLRNICIYILTLIRITVWIIVEYKNRFRPLNGQSIVEVFLEEWFHILFTIAAFATVFINTNSMTYTTCLEESSNTNLILFFIAAFLQRTTNKQVEWPIEMWQIIIVWQVQWGCFLPCYFPRLLELCCLYGARFGLHLFTEEGISENDWNKGY